MDAKTIDNAETARRALEVACAGKDPKAITEIYATGFLDHVNGLEFHGTDGRSVALYRELFPDLRFVVEEQALPPGNG